MARVKKTVRKKKKIVTKKAQKRKTQRAVRNWSRPLPLTEIKKMKKRGIKTIVSTSGFTKGAIKYAKRAKISLYHKTRKIV
ncbi:MAG: hypothetical protein ABDH37_04395 [Candidatus Hydrothermales bacterium]